MGDAVDHETPGDAPDERYPPGLVLRPDALGQQPLVEVWRMVTGSWRYAAGADGWHGTILALVASHPVS